MSKGWWLSCILGPRKLILFNICLDYWNPWWKSLRTNQYNGKTKVVVAQTLLSSATRQAKRLGRIFFAMGASDLGLEPQWADLVTGMCINVLANLVIYDEPLSETFVQVLH